VTGDPGGPEIGVPVAPGGIVGPVRPPVAPPESCWEVRRATCASAAALG